MISVIEFDFDRRQDRTIPDEDVPAARAAGRFCWVDVEAPTPEEADGILRRLDIAADIREEILGPDREGRFDVHDCGLHFAVTEARFHEGSLVTAHVDAVIGAGFLLTYHRREADFLRRMRRACHEDFIAFSQSPGFLLYEIGDHLIEQYRRSLQTVSDLVEGVQLRLFGTADDTIFKDVAGLASDLSAFRKIILGTRELLHELATRRSPFVSETTQPFLSRMAGTMERLDADLSAERELLNSSLNLYMGMVSHRTNRIVSRLTVLSMIFLPLTFLCGVYGMNFEVLPETKWPHGYLYFWLTALAVAGGLFALMKRARWI